jgi:HAD superfamily phosphoserine phosphatase-like hydrolase
MSKPDIGGDDHSEKRVVHAYVFLETPVHSSSVLDTVVTGLPSALEPNLTPLSPCTALSRRVFYQPFTTASTQFSALDVRTYRQSPACEVFETWNGAEVVLLPGSPSSGDTFSIPIPPPAATLRLAVFDMDSTLIDQEVIDELAAQVGRKAEVQAITERAMRGELDFAGSLRERVSMLRGVPADVWEKLRERITIAKGAQELCNALKRNGVRLAVFSGGFQPMAEWLKGELGLDVAVANHVGLLFSSPLLFSLLLLSQLNADNHHLAPHLPSNLRVPVPASHRGAGPGLSRSRQHAQATAAAGTSREAFCSALTGPLCWRWCQ